jgi:histidinol dehydrogenase
MKVVSFPDRNSWIDLAQRPVLSTWNETELLQSIFDDVKENGDRALISYTQRFDGISLESVRYDPFKQINLLSLELKNAIDQAYENIRTFHLDQKEQNTKIETMTGVSCWRESRAIDRVGLYIPGGSAPLFSTVLMLGIPAQIAACSQIVLCSPPDETASLHPAILYAAKLCGITEVFTLGGVQAIAAMTIGTESVPAVDKLFGPGNAYVTAAKKFALNYKVAIDMPAGPSEVLVIADQSAKLEYIAADLLSQAEHGPDSQVILLTNSLDIASNISSEIEKQLIQLEREGLARKSIENSRTILFETIDDCLEFSNLYAPEHLIVMVENAENYLIKIQNAGSVFVGNYSCESIGDYASGTNHTLPTNGYAKAYSGVSLDSFVKKITFQKVTLEGLRNIGPIVEIMAEAEGLTAHKNAVSIRLKMEENV